MFNPIKTALIPTVLALTLSACHPTDSRECGVFDHPEFASWEANSDAATRLYMNSEGREVRMERSWMRFNESFVETATLDPMSDVSCPLTASYDLTSNDLGLEIQVQYQQLEQVNVESKDERLDVRFRSFAYATPNDFSHSGIQLMGNDESFDAMANNSATLNYFSTLEINGVLYQDVFEQRFVQVQSSNDARDVYTVYFARRVGVLGFSLAEGEEPYWLVER